MITNTMEETAKGDGMYMMKKSYMEPESTGTAEYVVREDDPDMRRPDLEMGITNAADIAVREDSSEMMNKVTGSRSPPTRRGKS